MPDGRNGDAAARGAPNAAALAGTRLRRRSSPTLGGRLLALVAAVTLPLLALAGGSAWTAQDGIRRQAEASLLGRAQGIALAVEREFDRADALLQALAASSALARGDLRLFEEEMRAASRAFGGVAVSLIAADGTLLVSTLWPPGERRAGEPAPEEARRVAEEGRAQVTNLFPAPAGAGPAVAVGVPLPAAAHELPEGLARPAAIGLRFPRERIDAVLDQAAGLRGGGLAEGWTAAIIDRAGVPVARVPGGAGPVGQPSAPQSLAGLAGSADGLVRGRMTPEGVPTIAAVARGERSGYRYLLAMPLAEFTAPLDRALLRTLLAGAVVVAIGLGLSALLAHRTVEAFRAVRGAASGRAQPGATALREAEELAHAIAEAAADRNRVEAALVASERRNREVLESLGERLFALDGEGRVRFASRAALEGWNTAADDLLHRRFEEVFPAAVGSVTWEAVRTALVGREEVHLCGRSPLLERWVEVDAYPSADGGLVVAFRDIDDLRHAYRDRAQATEALRGSEERLRFALEAAELGSWEVDLRAGVVRRSPRALEVFGFGPEAAEDRYPSWRGRMHPEDRAGAVGAIEAAVAGRIEAYRVEYRHQRPDGRWIWVESHGRVVARDPATGAATRLAGTSRDVTERRAAEERQALLAREVDHRAKNALAVVQAAVRLTPKADPAGFARAIEGRVNALARAQTLLAADRWSSADLRSLIEGELAPFLAAGEDRPAAVLSGPRVALPAEATQPIAMAVHELATNAVKHGALSRRGGQVLVYWTLDTDRDPAQLELRWVERGGPPVSGDPERRGFGSRVLDGTVRRQLGGRVELEWDASGLVCRITVPLRSPATARRRAGERLEAVE